ncbi:MAG: RIP metalloprotease RseP [Verrucomicrobiae bacterium]|nr:RIP metalloprotease RseP [Verrucomicrobiae bacterium]
MLLTILIGVYVALVVLVMFNLTITIHELGHFLVGRWRKATIERFSIWFGQALWKKKVNGVEYRLGWIPLGGYVLFPQMAMESIEGKCETPAEQLKPLKPSDKIWISLAGSVSNILLALVVAAVIWVVGLPQDESLRDMTVGYVDPQSKEYEAGIRPGDRLLSINGEKVEDWQEVLEKVALSLSEKVKLDLEREGKLFQVELMPGRHHLFKIRKLNLDRPARPLAGGLVDGMPAAVAGVRPGDEFLEFNGQRVLGLEHLIRSIQARANQPTPLVVQRGGERKELSVTPVVPPGAAAAQIGVSLGVVPGRDVLFYPNPWRQVKKHVIMTFNTLNALFHPKTTGVGLGDLSGPVGIGWQLVLRVLEDFRLALDFMVLVNVNLAILNLLPIPALDGGHIVLTIIEAIRRKPLNQKWVEITQTACFGLLVALILYVTFNDFVRMHKVHGMKNTPPPAATAPPSKAPAPAPAKP